VTGLNCKLSLHRKRKTAKTNWMRPSNGEMRLLLFASYRSLRKIDQVSIEKKFRPQSSPSPSQPPHHSPFTPVEDDYLLLLLAADLRMDPTPRPRPVSSLASVTLYNSTTLLNDGIFTVHQFFRCDIRSTAQIGMCFSILRIQRNLTTHQDFFICT
jgi:hypothetical protein